MKMKLKSILAIALCAVGLSAFAEEPAGSEGNPWLVGTPNEADVKAWTNGTGKLTIEGTCAMKDFGAGDPAPWYNDREAITTVEIKSGVTRIGLSTFLQCSVLESVTIPSSVTSIGQSAFTSCKGLKSVTIPPSVTSISDYAFSYCSGLESVTIPSSVTSIGEYAFQDCSGLKSFIEMREEPPTAGEKILGTSFKGKIYVPMEKLLKYKRTKGWSTYLTKMVPAYLVSGVAEHGALEMSKNCFPTNEYTTASETVTVTATPDEGYRLKSLVWNDGTDRDITEAKSFTMPLACVTVTAVFEDAAKPDEEVVATAEATFVLGPALAVANVKTATHWPWDGKIDVTCDLTGSGNVQLSAALTTNGVTVCTAKAANVTGETVIDLDQVGGVTNGVKFVWNAKADCPAGFNSKDTKVKVTAMKVQPLGGVQLWKDGPYFAECNVGAEKPEEYGILTNFNDAAQAVTEALGGDWRLPTEAEWNALLTNCGKGTWTEQNGVKGRLFTGTGDYESNSIFLPAAGFDYSSGRAFAGDRGSFWSSEAFDDDSAWYLYFDVDDASVNCRGRSFGLSIRAVRDAK